MNHCKIFFASDIGSGEKSLSYRFCHDIFPHNHRADDVNFLVKDANIDGKLIEVRIWFSNYTSNAEREYHENKKSYQTLYRCSHVIFLTFDLTNFTSFAHVKNWKQKINSYEHKDTFLLENTVVILVGNKSDLTNKRAVSYQQAKSLADEYGIQYYEVSAKTGKNVSELFEAAISRKLPQILHQGLQLSSKTVFPEQSQQRTGYKKYMKLVLICAGEGSGKRELALKYYNAHPTEEATIGSSFLCKTVQIKERDYKLEINDTPTTAKYISLHHMYMRYADIALVIINTTMPFTVDMKLILKQKLAPLFLFLSDNLVILLVGTHIDLADKGDRKITYEEGCALAKELRAFAYMECSAKTGEGVNEVFEAALVKFIESTSSPALNGKLAAPARVQKAVPQLPKLAAEQAPSAVPIGDSEPVTEVKKPPEAEGTKQQSLPKSKEKLLKELLKKQPSKLGALFDDDESLVGPKTPVPRKVIAIYGEDHYDLAAHYTSATTDHGGINMCGINVLPVANAKELYNMLLAVIQDEKHPRNRSIISVIAEDLPYIFKEDPTIIRAKEIKPELLQLIARWSRSHGQEDTNDITQRINELCHTPAACIDYLQNLATNNEISVGIILAYMMLQNHNLIIWSGQRQPQGDIEFCETRIQHQHLPNPFEDFYNDALHVLYQGGNHFELMTAWEGFEEEPEGVTATISKICTAFQAQLKQPGKALQIETGAVSQAGHPKEEQSKLEGSPESSPQDEKITKTVQQSEEHITKIQETSAEELQQQAKKSNDDLSKQIAEHDKELEHLNKRITELGDSKQLVEEQRQQLQVFQEDREILKDIIEFEKYKQMAASKCQEHANLHLYYNAVFTRIKSVFDSASAAAGGLAGQAKGQLHAAAEKVEIVSDAIDIALSFTMIASPVGKLIKAGSRWGITRQLDSLDSSKQKSRASRISMSAIDIDKVPVLVALKLTSWYEPQLRQLSVEGTKSNPEKPAMRLAELAFAWIAHNLLEQDRE